MGLFSSLKGDRPSDTHERQNLTSIAHHEHDEYAPPPGPPPSHTQHNLRDGRPDQEYTAPPGPPPNYRTEPVSDLNEYAPPPGPPPSQKIPDYDPPPYHDWTVVPDTSSLPPPPSIGHDLSPSGNADSYEADRAHAWCKVNGIMMPHQPTQDQVNLVAAGRLGLVRPQEYDGLLRISTPGRWSGSTRPGSRDCCLLTNYPLYFAYADSPLSTRKEKTVYFEMKLKSLGKARGGDQSSLAIGFSTVPYPPWRMPGWERGSLAVHSDDGRRYVNDTWGGKDFVAPFQIGETIGLGIRLNAPSAPPEYGTVARPLEVYVFLTRNGREIDGWNIHEQLDASNDKDIEGLDGNYDLYGALGVFGGAEFDVVFQRQDWLWRQH